MNTKPIDTAGIQLLAAIDLLVDERNFYYTMLLNLVDSNDGVTANISAGKLAVLNGRTNRYLSISCDLNTRDLLYEVVYE